MSRERFRRFALVTLLVLLAAVATDRLRALWPLGFDGRHCNVHRHGAWHGPLPPPPPAPPMPPPPPAQAAAFADAHAALAEEARRAGEEARRLADEARRYAEAQRRRVEAFR